jgi:lysine 2,3-aminomutase
MRHWKEIPLFKDVTYGEWSDWRWQWRNRIESVEELSKVIPLTEEAAEGINTALQKVRMAITPYYASLIDSDDERCPIRMQAVPTASETLVKPWESVDPLDEDADSPVEGLVHRYPDRVLFLVTEQCSMYCRHCTRRRVVGVTDRVATKERMERASAISGSTRKSAMSSYPAGTRSPCPTTGLSGYCNVSGRSHTWRS